MSMESKSIVRWLVALAASVVLFSGCVSVKNDNSIVPPPALISVVKAPLTMPNGPIPCHGLKCGVASGSFYIYEYIFTDLSVTIWTATLEKAMRDGGISKLHYADYEMLSILGYVTTFKVSAYGE